MGGRIGRQNSQFLTFFDFQNVITQREMLQTSSSSASKQPFLVQTQFIHKSNEIVKEQKLTRGRIGRQKSKKSNVLPLSNFNNSKQNIANILIFRMQAALLRTNPVHSCKILQIS